MLAYIGEVTWGYRAFNNNATRLFAYNDGIQMIFIPLPKVLHTYFSHLNI